MNTPSVPRLLIRYTRFLMVAMATVLYLLTAVGLLTKFWWLFEVATHFTVQYAVALAVLLLYFIVRRQVWLPVATVLFLGINLFPVVRYYHPVAVASDETPRLRVLTLNLWASNDRIDLVRQLVLTERPDVVFLSEVTNRWRVNLRSLETAYSYRLPAQEAERWPILLMSKWPIGEFKLLRLGIRLRPTIIATICPPAMPRTCVRIAGLHTDRPQSAEFFRSRNSQLNELAAIMMTDRNSPFIVLGDLNLTPWSPYFREFLVDASLRDSAAGRGVHPTWMSSMLPFGLVIDHVLVSPDIKVMSRHVGPYVGSDHFPVIADLVF